MTVSRSPGIWFPAKRYGWGWGPPVTWQGWSILLAWVVLLFAGVLWLLPQHPALHVVFVLVMAAGLIGICYAKGEPPRWRWGDPK